MADFLEHCMVKFPFPISKFEQQMHSQIIQIGKGFFLVLKCRILKSTITVPLSQRYSNLFRQYLLPSGNIKFQLLFRMDENGRGVRLWIVLMEVDTEHRKIYYCDSCIEAFKNRFLDLPDNSDSVNVGQVPGI